MRYQSCNKLIAHYLDCASRVACRCDMGWPNVYMNFIMQKVQVFDPALCCSSGVCGTDVDQALVNFSADVDWARRNGVPIKRFNLAKQPMAFRIWSIISFAFGSSDLGALRRYKSLMWHGHTARFAPSMASLTQAAKCGTYH